MEPFERYRPIVEGWEAFQEALRRPLPLCIWANPLRVEADRLASVLEAEGIRLRPVSWNPGAFRILDRGVKPGRQWGFLAGLFQVQEEAAMLPVRILDPGPGERILDLCAAPGNKTAQLAVALANGGTVVANDRNPVRIRALRQVIDRLGLFNVSTTAWDGGGYPPEAGLFDRVLVDVPCTCEGTSRKSPEVLRDAGGERFRRMAGLQRALLRKAVQLCRPGGRVVYATCTYAPEENEGVVDWILRDDCPGWVRVVPARVPGVRCAEGLTAWRGRSFDPSLRQAMRVWPHQNDTGGFFVAALERLAPVEERASPASAHPDRPARPRPADARPDRFPFGKAEMEPEALSILEERFGIRRPDYGPTAFFRRNARAGNVVCGDHQPPVRPDPEAIGMEFMRFGFRFPKISTGAAMAFGTKADRNRVPLNRAQVDAYMARREVRISEDQARDCTEMGYVMVEHEGFVLGVGLYRPDATSGRGVVESLFPKAWCPGGETATELPEGDPAR